MHIKPIESFLFYFPQRFRENFSAAKACSLTTHGNPTTWEQLSIRKITLVSEVQSSGIQNYSLDLSFGCLVKNNSWHLTPCITQLNSFRPMTQQTRQYNPLHLSWDQVCKTSSMWLIWPIESRLKDMHTHTYRNSI